MAEKLLPSARFGGWSTIRDESSDTHINQIWRTTLSSPVRGTQGFVLTSYRVEECDNGNSASAKISDFITRRRFTDYIVKGFDVIPTPWSTPDGFGALFNISGVTRGDTDIYNRAMIYALGLTRGSTAITLEIRLSVSGENTNDLKKSIEKNDITVLSNELGKFIISMWQPEAVKIPNDPILTIMPKDPPPVVKDPDDIVIDPEVIIDPVNDDPPKTLDPNNDPPKTIDANPINENRWFTVDHHLSIVIPPNWKYSGNKNQSTWLNADNSSLRIYAAEKYDTNADLASAIDDFATSQQAISLRKFTRSPFAIDDAVGVLVRYSDFNKNTTQSYLFGKSGRIWRIDISISGESAPLTDEVRNMILSIKAD
ncbi:MAG: hypothetical protein WCO98_12930 [bacterium]